MQKPLNRDAIKLAAMATMACNHFAQALLPGGTLLYTVLVNIGYFTAPVMCWFLVEGFGCTRSRGRYALRLAGFALLAQAPGVRVVDDPAHSRYPMPLETSDQDLVFVGRLREDISDDTHHSLTFWCCGDQVRKGAATNAVQIAQLLIEE